MPPIFKTSCALAVLPSIKARHSAADGHANRNVRSISPVLLVGESRHLRRAVAFLRGGAFALVLDCDSLRADREFVKKTASRRAQRTLATGGNFLPTPPLGLGCVKTLEVFSEVEHLSQRPGFRTHASFQGAS
jgi:hypothetical protein